jgi:hypothetical protein
MTKRHDGKQAVVLFDAFDVAHRPVVTLRLQEPSHPGFTLRSLKLHRHPERRDQANERYT